MASLRLSQQRPEEAKDSALKAWNTLSGLDTGKYALCVHYACFDIIVLDDALLPLMSTRIELAKRFIELADHASALQVIQSVMASDDQEVEAWYLEGWCFYLMAEQAKESGQKIDDLGWEELAKDARECLETCRTVCASASAMRSSIHSFEQLHTKLQHPDEQVLGHVTELISQLDALGIKISPDDDEEWSGFAGDDNEWEDVSDGGSGEGSDVEMG